MEIECLDCVRSILDGRALENPKWRAALYTEAAPPEIAVHIDGDFPAPISNYRPGWPVTAWRIEAKERKSPPFEISVPYVGQEFESAPEALRLIEWNGKEYVDITQRVDLKRGCVSGLASGWGLFAVVELEDGAPLAARK